MFNTKKETEEHDSLDWDIEAPQEEAAPAEESIRDDIISPSNTGCIISAGTILNGDIEANDNVVLEGSMNGNLKSSGHVRISGKMVGNAEAASLNIEGGSIEGNVTTKEALTIAADSSLKGDVVADVVRLNGTIVGNMKVAGKLTMTSTASITGDVQAAVMIMEEGSHINGHFTIG